jgi:hypothetical protein
VTGSQFFQKLLLCSLSIICCTSYAQHDGCDLKRDSDGVKVYTCKTEDDKFRLLIADFELANTSLTELQAFLWDVKNYVNWQYNMVEAEMLANINANEITYRSLVDAPWPVDDRELMLSLKWVSEPAQTKIIIKNIVDDAPPPDDVVRVPFFDASWTILTDGKNLRVTYRLKIDPGGTVPAWLANLAMAEGPHVSFKKLKEQIEKK